MFDFDNMGFTNTVEHIKYLSCSDCEVGKAVQNVPYGNTSGWTPRISQPQHQKELSGTCKVKNIKMFLKTLNPVLISSGLRTMAKI